MQWATSPAVSLARVMAPFALRDPYRMSHYTSPLYRALWPNAKDYLINLSNSANGAVLDMIMPGWQDYALSIDRMCTAVWAGEDPKTALQRAAAEWDATTQKLGRRQPARGLSAVREAARLLCRPHDRDDGPGRAHHVALDPPIVSAGRRARQDWPHRRLADSPTARAGIGGHRLALAEPTLAGSGWTTLLTGGNLLAVLSSFGWSMRPWDSAPPGLMADDGLPGSHGPSGTDNDRRWLTKGLIPGSKPARGSGAGCSACRRRPASRPGAARDAQ